MAKASVTFALPERDEITINGHTFLVLKSDLDILKKSKDIILECEKLMGVDETNLSTQDVVALIDCTQSAANFIDEILGVGATAEIMEGVPLEIMYALFLLSEIVRLVKEARDKRQKGKYGTPRIQPSAGQGEPVPEPSDS